MWGACVCLHKPARLLKAGSGCCLIGYLHDSAVPAGNGYSGQSTDILVVAWHGPSCIQSSSAFWCFLIDPRDLLLYRRPKGVSLLGASGGWEAALPSPPSSLCWSMCFLLTGSRDAVDAQITPTHIGWWVALDYVCGHRNRTYTCMCVCVVWRDLCTAITVLLRSTRQCCVHIFWSTGVA